MENFTDFFCLVVCFFVCFWVVFVCLFVFIFWGGVLGCFILFCFLIGRNKQKKHPQEIQYKRHWG